MQTPSMNLDELWHTIQSVEASLAQYTEAPFPPPEMNAPATPLDLDRLGQHLRLKLPPSYREFLSLHDGGTNFLCDMPLLSTREMIAGEPGWVEELAEEDPVLARFFIAGSDASNAGYMVFDTRVVSAEGEMETVHLSLRLEETRWPSFRAMLEARLRGSETALGIARADRDKLED